MKYYTLIYYPLNLNIYTTLERKKKIQATSLSFSLKKKKKTSLLLFHLYQKKKKSIFLLMHNYLFLVPQKSRGSPHNFPSINQSPLTFYPFHIQSQITPTYAYSISLIDLFILQRIKI